MPYYAFDTVTSKTYNVSKWAQKCNNRNTGLCLVCKEEMYIRASQTPTSKTHFAHYPNSKCPTVKANRSLFTDLKPSEYDEENAKQLKLQFKKNL